MEYVTEDGKILRGTFVPMVFEVTSVHRSISQIVRSDGDEEQELEMSTHEIYLFSRETGQRIGTCNLESLVEVSKEQQDGDQGKDQSKDKHEEGLLSWRYEGLSPAILNPTTPNPDPNTIQGKIHYTPSSSPSPSPSQIIRKSTSTSTSSFFKAAIHKDTGTTPHEIPHFSSSPKFKPIHLEHEDKEERAIIEHVISRLGEVPCYSVMGTSVEVVEMV